ncbi:MAG: PAS domain-containing sensor histidine kinase [Sphingomonadales bacterium]|nr:PAS domain-containing sensor histidine kinase [Sphingomonadales bacterium]
MTSNMVGKPLSGGLGGRRGNPPLEPVRRIDWDHCTILPSDAFPSQPPKPSNDAKGMAVENFLNSITIDDALPIYVAAPDGRVLFVNAAYRELAQTCETPVASVQATAPGHAPEALMSVLKDVAALCEGLTLQEKVRIGGRVRHYRSRHFPILDRAGRMAAIAGTYMDCTKEVEGLELARAAQQRFQDFARASSDWYWETDRDGRLTLLSDRLTAIIGIPAARFIGHRFDEIGALAADAQGRFPARDGMITSRAFRDQLYAMKSADGEDMLFHLSGVPIFDQASGEFMGFRGAGMDVTARMQAEQQTLEIRRNLENTLEELTNKNIQLDLASGEAERALKIKSDFLAAMSHELRTPLNAIIGFAEAMKLEVFGKIGDQYKGYSDDIMNAGRHLLGLINDILDVAVIESDKIKLDIEAAPLRDIIDAALNLVIIRANKKALDTSAVRVSGKWLLDVDVRRATQVFVNLFSNAVKFTPDKGRIGVEVKEVGDGFLAITVWDSGIGIPPSKHELVFDKFQQCADSIYARREEGTGLGLHISRHLARLMGGDISLQSEVGEGSRFTVTLPLHKE